MANSGRRSFVQCLLKGFFLPGMDRLWWWIALVSILSLLGQEIARTSALAIAVSSVPDFEGFGDESEEADEEPLSIVSTPPPPPSLHRKSGFETDRGPPSRSSLIETEGDEGGKGGKIGAAEDAIETSDQTSSLSSQAHETLTFSAPSSSPSAPAAAAKRHEYWDEDEFEGLPEQEESVSSSASSSSSSSSSSSPSDLSSEVSNQDPKSVRSRIDPRNYILEIACICFLIVFAIAYFFGKKENEKIVLAWAAQFASKDCIFEKNFSLLGTGPEADSPLLIKEGQNLFKFYASGRRFCKGLLATMDLQCRHDLITCIWYLISPRKDEITIDVFMNDENMEPITFALVRKKIVKAMVKEWRDIQTFAPVQSQQRKGLSEELVFISESRELGIDLLTDAVIDQVFGEKAFQKYGSNFVSLHFTDEFPVGSHKKILQFKFTLPSIHAMTDMSRLIALVPYYIDLVGRYKLNAQLRTKADSARAKVAQEAFKEAQSARQEALQKRKEERRKALESSESRVATEVLRKREEKERLRQMKKAMPKIKVSRA